MIGADCHFSVVFFADIVQREKKKRKSTRIFFILLEIILWIKTKFLKFSFESGTPCRARIRTSNVGKYQLINIRGHSPGLCLFPVNFVQLDKDALRIFWSGSELLSNKRISTDICIQSLVVSLQDKFSRLISSRQDTMIYFTIHSCFLRPMHRIRVNNIWNTTVDKHCGNGCEYNHSVYPLTAEYIAYSPLDVIFFQKVSHCGKTKSCCLFQSYD